MFIQVGHFVHGSILLQIFNIIWPLATLYRPSSFSPASTLLFVKQHDHPLLNIKMSTIFGLALLLLYFWYFFSYSLPSVPEPLPAVPPNPPPPPFHLIFSKPDNKVNKFQFAVNNLIAWEHEIPDEKTYMIRTSGDVVRKDVCYYVPNGHAIPATGRVLYDYLKQKPDWRNRSSSSFAENSPYTVQRGNVFYFTCRNSKIHEVGMCPSGTVFGKGRCIPVSSCTGKPDGTLIADPESTTHYFECKNQREFQHYCGKDKFFYRDRCIPRDELAHFCKFHTSVEPFVIDDEGTTRVQCVDSKPVYTRCSPGFRFFERDRCESTRCVGKPDGTKLPLPDRTVGDFRFSPGYAICHADKVRDDPVTCPQIWDPLSSRGDDLTHLPMVFDGRGTCAVPSFCDNVFAEDPGAIVPVHEFTKDVRNWKMSELYDSRAGYVCEAGRKRRVAVPGPARINKRFRTEDGCRSSNSGKLPVSGNSTLYYDCALAKETACPPNEFFQGFDCVRKPFEENEKVFTYRDVPLFRFEPLNVESWITPWNYGGVFTDQCRAPESVALPLHKLCSHPDCVPYDFLSMIPDLALFLPPPSPTTDRFKCRYDETNRKLRREPVPEDVRYRFWEQRIVREEEEEEEAATTPERCTPGQKLKTGNYIYDSTVYATCDATQPFLFCPSAHTDRIFPVESHYACETLVSNLVEFSDLNPATHFADNEVKRILPVDWNGTDRFKLSATKPFEDLPEEGYELDPNLKNVTLEVTRPVRLELRFRVTHPPHVAFEYEEDARRVRHDRKGKGFLVKRNDFTDKPLDFPRYRAVPFVDDLKATHG